MPPPVTQTIVNLGGLTSAQGFRITGADSVQYIAKSVSGGGDINGDGIDDLIVGAYRSDSNGYAYVIYGKEQATRGNINVGALSASDGFYIHGAEYMDSLGSSVAFAGDVNFDGFDDIVIGASDAATVVNSQNISTGAAYVIYGSGSATRQNIELSTLTEAQGFSFRGFKSDGEVGYSVASAGDINGDGIDDLIVGAPKSEVGTGSNAEPEVGITYIIYGRNADTRSNFNLADLSPSDGFAISGFAAYDELGNSVSAAGDVNFDGIGDLIIGNWESDFGGPYTGAAFVIYGKSGTTRTDFNVSDVIFSNPTSNDGFLIIGEDHYDRAGSSVGSLGDINGDGIDDIIIGAFGSDDVEDTSGTAYVVYGVDVDTRELIDFTFLTSSQGFKIFGTGHYDSVGISVSSAGDVNGDGVGDMLVGASQVDGSAGAYSGAVYVIYGSSNATRSNIYLDQLSSDQGFIIEGGAANDRLGISVAAAGDVNGDGGDDLIVGAWYDSAGGYYSGAAYVLYGTPPQQNGLVLIGTEGNDGFGALEGAENNDTITGLGGDDFMVGNAGDDVMYGGAGNDHMIARVGNDTMEGGDDNDDMHGEEGDDSLLGGNGDDWLKGYDGVDTLTGENGNDTLDGGVGDDWLIGGAGNDILKGETVFWENGNDTLDGGAGDDSLIGGEGDDVLGGGEGNDTLNGGAGNNTLNGGDGDDTYVLDNPFDSVSDSGGIDLVESSITYQLLADFENLTLTGGAITGYGNAADNVVTGNDSDNTLGGLAGNDTLIGGVGNDALHGGVGNDSLTGGEGDDVLAGNDDNDTLIGDIGDDTLYGDAGEDSLNGGAGNDTLTGGEGNDTLDGGLAADTMVGGAGDDLYIVDNDADVVSEDENQGIDTVKSEISHTLQANFENLELLGTVGTTGTGNSGNNRITGNYYDNALYGLDGNDTLEGSYGSDTLVGGKGDDTYILNNIGDVIVEDADSGSDTVETVTNFTLADNFENLMLTGTYTVQGWGNSADNDMTGNDVSNRLYGLGGNDDLDGGDGADSLFGGDGDDWVDGGSGNDSLTGGSGDDGYFVDSAGDVIVEATNGGSDFVYSLVTHTLSGNIEILRLWGSDAIDGTGNAQANSIYGNYNANRLYGLDGNDTLDGYGGNDTMTGGMGDDTYIVDEAGDVIVEAKNGGIDTVQTYISITMAANVENIVLMGNGAINVTGTTTHNVLTGNASENYIWGLNGDDTIQGGAGNDTLDGGSGGDSLTGGDDDDTYIVDSARDIVVEDENKGTDLIQSSVSYRLSANVENLVLTGASSDFGTGNALDNMIYGNAKANVLTGMAGSDSLYGGAGHDTLDGGAGADFLEGGAGNDVYMVSDDGDVAYELNNEGIDLVLCSTTYFAMWDNVDNLTFTGKGNNTGFGNNIANMMIGNAGADYLLGGAGNDTIDGGLGNDELAGGSGNDTFIVDSAGDQVYEQEFQGTDLVLSSVTYTLSNSQEIENLTLTGVAASGTGNSLGNVIVGNSSANTLSGLDGNDSLSGGNGRDRLIGGQGSDTLTGGSDVDTFVFNDLASVDRITDFRSGTDKISLDKSVFTAWGSAGTLTQAAFYSASGATAAADPSDRVIYNKTTGALYYDADGVGGNAAVQIAVLDGRPSFAYTDVLIF